MCHVRTGRVPHLTNFSLVSSKLRDLIDIGIVFEYCGRSRPSCMMMVSWDEFCELVPHNSICVLQQPISSSSFVAEKHCYTHTHTHTHTHSVIRFKCLGCSWQKLALMHLPRQQLQLQMICSLAQSLSAKM